MVKSKKADTLKGGLPAGNGPASGAVVEQPMVTAAPKKGEPITRGGTSKGLAGQIVTAANRWRENYNPLRGLNMRRVVELLELGQRGDTAYLQWTFRFIERRYPTLSALISRCEAPLVNFDWRIKVSPELPPGATEAMANAQKETLENAYDGIDNLRDAIKHLAHADFRGYAHLQKHYSPDGDVMHLEPLHQWCVCRDGLAGNWFWNPDSRSTSQPLAFLGKDFCMGGDALPLGDFIIRTAERPIDEIALVNFVRANLCEKDWDGFIEIYGIPGGVVVMPGNVPTGKETEYETAAKLVAEGGSGAIPNGSDYKANDGPRGVDPFTPRLDHLDEQLIMAGTGGKLTMLSESGTGTLAGNAHADTFQAIASGRAQQISECFQRQFDAAILAQQHEGEPALVFFELAAKDETDVAALVKDVVALFAAGFQAEPKWLSEKTGYELKAAPPGGPTPQETTALKMDNAKLGPSNQPVANRLSRANRAEQNTLVATAVAEDLHPVYSRLARIADIQDDAVFEQKVRQLCADFPQLSADILKDPSAARALLPIITDAFTEGLKS